MRTLSKFARDPLPADYVLLAALVLFAKDNREKFKAQFGTMLAEMIDKIEE